MAIYIHATALRLKADKSVDICYCLLLLIDFQYRLLRLEIKIFDNHELHKYGDALYFLIKYK